MIKPTLDEMWAAVVDHYKSQSIKLSQKPNQFVINHMYQELQKFRRYTSERMLVDPEFKEKTMESSLLKKITSKRAKFWSELNDQ